jgi:hypothetical protein
MAAGKHENLPPLSSMSRKLIKGVWAWVSMAVWLEVPRFVNLVIIV